MHRRFVLCAFWFVLHAFSSVLGVSLIGFEITGCCPTCKQDSLYAVREADLWV